jgi:uncharacterized membrane protein YjjP (DUF1212 family)
MANSRPLQPEPPNPEQPEPDDRVGIQYVLDLALGVGAALLSSGVGAVDVAASMTGVIEAYGVRRAQIDITFNQIMVSYRHRLGDDPQTAVEQVRSRSLDYTRLQETDKLVQRILTGRLTAVEAQAELDRIVQAPHPYPRWASTVALSVMAAGLASLLGAGLAVVGVAAIVTACVDRIGRLLNGRGVLLFFQQIIGAAVATSATVLLALVHLPIAANPALVVAASIIVLLAGQAVVGAVQDTLTGFYLTSVARAVEIALLSVGLMIGVTLALRVGLLFGVNVAVTAQIHVGGLLSVPTRVLSGAVAAAAAAVACYATVRGALAAGFAGVGGSAVVLLLGYAGLDPVASSFGAATLVGLAGATLSRQLRVPPLLIGMAGIVPLVPGLATYRGFVGLATGDGVLGVSSLSQAVATALALAAGVLLGQYVGQPVRRRIGRFERDYIGPRLAGAREETGARATASRGG